MIEISKSNISTAIYRHRRKVIRIIINPLKKKYKYYLMRTIFIFSTQVTHHGSSKTTVNLRLRIGNKKEIRWYIQTGTVSLYLLRTCSLVEKSDVSPVKSGRSMKHISVLRKFLATKTLCKLES